MFFSGTRAEKLEVDEAFPTRQKWIDWQQANRELFDRTVIARAIGRIRDKGFTEPLTGALCADRKQLNAFGKARDELVLRNIDYNVREGLAYNGLNSRMRAVLKAVGDALLPGQTRLTKIYAPEAVTDFALRLRGLFPKFVGSEFTNDTDMAKELFPIPVEDLMRLTFPDSTFDMVVANDVLEHVPDINQALREMCRVLKPGGWHIGTVPFLAMSDTSLVRARLENGEIRHLMEPEYHGDPMSANGSLVFEIPGWDILSRAKEAGFSLAVFRAMMSEAHAYLDYGGVLILCLRK